DWIHLGPNSPRKCRVAAHYEPHPEWQHPPPNAWRLKNQIVPFEPGEVVRHLHVENAAGLQNAHRLLEHKSRIVCVLQNVRRIDDVEALIWKWEALCAASRQALGLNAICAKYSASATQRRC